MRRTLLLLTLILAGLSPELDAQLVEPSTALSLARAERRADGNWHYQYRIAHRGDTAQVYMDAYVDVSSPKTSRRPTLSEGSGTFLFDALSTRFDDVAYGHPPLAVHTPDRWSGAIYLNGSLSWGASRFGSSTINGVHFNQTLEGFGLISPAVPAFRPFRVVPGRAMDAVESLPEVPVAVDSSYVFLEGFVLAPGWMPEQITDAYLADQVAGACWLRAMQRCDLYQEMVARIRAAGQQGGRSSDYRNAIEEFLRRVEEDPTMNSQGKIVLRGTARALLRR